MKENVDVLTLSATPIPRTLHMSLIGIRDMSVLEEAPNDRMPIQTYVMEYNDPNKNYNLNSKEQYISVDLQPVDFGWYNGFTLFARATKAKGYAFRLCTAQNGLSLVKYDGEDRSAAGSHYASNLDGVEYEGLMEYRPSGKNDVSFTSSHVYRMGLSVTTDYDKDGNEVAIIRGILFDITSWD